MYRVLTTMCCFDCFFFFSCLVDSGFAEGIKKILNVGEEQKELVDPYLVFSFAGKKVGFSSLNQSIMVVQHH